LNNEKLNEAVAAYQADRNDETFAIVYAMVKPEWRKAAAVAKSIRSTTEEIIALYEDLLLWCADNYDGKSQFIYFYRSSVAMGRARLYKKKATLSKREVYQSPSDEAATLEETVAADFNLEEMALSKKEADQRQLIDFLLNGADDFTAATVKAFLQHPKPTATAIAKELGVHHSKVLRALTRLAAKYDSTIFGEHRDYLFAH
jgi:hypothetical protein